MSTTLTWIVVIGSVVIFGGAALNTHRSRRARGLHTRPLGVTALTTAVLAVVGIALGLVCTANRSRFGTVEGMPWVFPYVLLIIGAYTWLLSRTRTGRYLYAVGNNKEAARRAGINVTWIVTFGFIMSSATAALAAVVYIGTQGSMSTDIDGGQLVLVAVASAVIGGTTLFGGRGRMVNGLAIMGVSAAVENMVTAVVLIAAVSLDALVRRRATR
jgi:D-xylose transport system permease protein